MVRFPANVRNIFLYEALRAALGLSQFPVQWSLWAVSEALKRLRPEADHTSLSNARVKNALNCTDTATNSYVA